MPSAISCDISVVRKYLDVGDVTRGVETRLVHLKIFNCSAFAIIDLSSLRSELCSSDLLTNMCIVSLKMCECSLDL